MIQGVQRPHGPWTLFAFLHETPNSVGQSNNNQNRLYVFHFIIYKSKGIERKNPIPCLFFFGLSQTHKFIRGLAATYSAEAYKIKFVLMPLPQAWVASIIGMNSAAIFPSMRMQSENEFPQTHLWTH